jgi:hypothetical protein
VGGGLTVPIRDGFGPHISRHLIPFLRRIVFVGKARAIGGLSRISSTTQPDRNAGTFCVACAAITRLQRPCNFAAGIHTKRETANMNNENKLDCAESIVRALERTASWRKTISPKFNDERNLKAAATLERLAIDAVNLTDEHWAALQPHYAWSSAIWRDALFNSTRQIGFAHGSKNLDAFIRLVLRQLSPVSIAA